MKILAFDTAAKTASVALNENGKIISEFFLDSGFTHSETVLPMAKALLDASKVKSEEIDVFAVNCGPGSFTGLRIGIAAVKAMAMANNKKCAAVSSLEALAYNTLGLNGIICPVMDARCGQVYTAFFENNGIEIKRLSEDHTVMADFLADEIKNAYPNTKVIFVGDGTKIMRSKLQNDYYISAPLAELNGKASSVSKVAEKIIEMGNLVSAGELSPNYLKLAQAEKEKLEREGKL